MEKEKLEKIKMIKKIKSEKRMMYIFIFLLILVIIFACLYFADKNNNIFGGKLAKHSNVKEKSSYAKDKNDGDNVNGNANQSYKNTANASKENEKSTNVASTANKDSEGKEADVAAKVAINKFKELGENVKKEDLEILKIQRDGEELYYISSKENTAEVRISDSKITRLNSVPVK